MNNKLQILNKTFENKKVWTVWNSDEEKYYISVVDIVSILTESKDVAAYWRKLKQRLKEEGNETVTNCHALKMPELVMIFCLFCALPDVGHLSRRLSTGKI